jgi:hypothetical protein
MKIKIIFLLLFGISFASVAFELPFDNDVSAWTTAKSKTFYSVVFDYKPDVDITLFSNEKFSFDSKLAGKYRYNYSKNGDVISSYSDLDWYRYWLRFSTDQFQARAGLQKIDFGPAQILRSLKWFDTIDPLDEQKESSGVNALLLKYYFLNNANIWAWGILSDDTTELQQLSASEEDKIEIGGRVQYPFEYAETALSFHARQLLDGASEKRIGFDSRWDFGVGLWMEGVISRFENYNHKWEKILTLGADITIPVGNGIYVLSEHRTCSKAKEELFENEDECRTSALLLSYPLGIISAAKTVASYDWKNEMWMRFFSYSLNFDYVKISLNYYWNSEFSEHSLMSGRSVQLLLSSSF